MTHGTLRKTLLRTGGGVLALLVAAFATPALAGQLDAANSSLELQIGTGPRVVVPASGDGVSLSTFGEGQTSAVVTGTVFAGTGFGPSTSLFAGLPPVSSVFVSSVADVTGAEFRSGVLNQTPFQNATVDGFGLQGVVPAFSGTAFASFADRSSATLFLSVGSVNRTTFPCGVGNVCTVGRLHTGTAVITGIQTPRVEVDGITGAILTLNPDAEAVVKVFTTGGGFTSTAAGATSFLSTVSVAGSVVGPAMEAPSVVTMVAPIRITTEGTFSLPGQLRVNLSFVPEPETLLLQLSAAAGLLLVGRWKARSRR